MIRKPLILFMLAAALGACVREDIQPCPPLQVTIGIGDRNYDNIDEVAASGLDTKRSDDEPFKAFASTLYYVIEDYATGEVIVERFLQQVDGDGLQVACEGIPEELPFGKYIVTAWGNLPDEEVLDEAGGVRTSVLHPGHVEGFDLYMACDTIDYDYDRGTHQLDLRRVKGKLLIETINLPASVRWSDKTIDNVAGSINSRFEYGEATAVKTTHEWGGEPSVLTGTYTAPSADGNASTLDVNFYDDASRNEPVCTPGAVNIPLSRNHITVVRYDYAAETGVFEMFILVDSRWENIHGLVMD